MSIITGNVTKKEKKEAHLPTHIETQKQSFIMVKIGYTTFIGGSEVIFMGWLTDEILFYGGLIMGGIVLIVLIIYLFVSRVRLAKLNARLDAEYGEREKK